MSLFDEAMLFARDADVTALASKEVDVTTLGSSVANTGAWVNISVTDTIVGALNVKLQSSSVEGSGYADVPNGDFDLPANAAVGDGLSFRLPYVAKKYVKIVASVATGGKITAFIGDQEYPRITEA